MKQKQMDICEKKPSFISPHSYSQFYKTALTIIGSSFNFHKVRSLGNQILDRLTQAQITQYNAIEIQAFQLSKQIKSKFTKLTHQDISAILIKTKNILQQFQKLCISLKVNFLFELFQRITVCLTILASTNYQDKDHQLFNCNKYISFTNLLDSPPLKLESKLMKNQKKQDNQINKNPPISKNTTRAQFKQISRDMKKLMLGGVNLYNQSYKRHIENRQLLINFMEIFTQNTERKQFWENLSRNYKQTIGTAEICKKDEKVNNKQQNSNEQNHKQFKQFSIALHNKSNDNNDIALRLKNGQNNIIISPQICNTVNARDIIYNAEIFDFQIQAQGELTDDIQQIINKVSQTYHRQKYFTLDSIKKLLKRMSTFYESNINTYKAKIKQLQKQIEDLERKLYTRSLNNRDVSIQTIPCKQIETLSMQLQKVNQNFLRMQNINKCLEQVISKQNINMMNFQKVTLENERRYEQQAKRVKIIEQQKQRLIEINKKNQTKQIENIQIKASYTTSIQKNVDRQKTSTILNSSLKDTRFQDIQQIDQIKENYQKQKNTNKSIYSSILNGIQQFLQKSNIDPSQTYPQPEFNSYNLGNKKMKYARSQKFIRQMNNNQLKQQDQILEQQSDPINVPSKKKSRKILRFTSNSSTPKNQSSKQNILQYNNLNLINQKQIPPNHKIIRFNLTNAQHQQKSSIYNDGNEKTMKEQQRCKLKSALKNSQHKIEIQQEKQNQNNKIQIQQLAEINRNSLKICPNLYALTLYYQQIQINQKQRIQQKKENSAVNIERKQISRTKTNVQIKRNHDDIINFEPINKNEVVQKLIKKEWDKQKQKKQQKYTRTQALSKTCLLSYPYENDNVKKQKDQYLLQKCNNTDSQFFANKRNNLKNKTINVICYENLCKQSNNEYANKDDQTKQNSSCIRVSSYNILQPIGKGEKNKRKTFHQYKSYDKIQNNQNFNQQSENRQKVSQKLKKISNNILNFKEVQQKLCQKNYEIDMKMSFQNQQKIKFNTVHSFSNAYLDSSSKIYSKIDIDSCQFQGKNRQEITNRNYINQFQNLKYNTVSHKRYESLFNAKRKFLKPSKITVSLNQTVIQQ